MNGMKTTIDSAGRLVIPIEIRRRTGITPGMSLEIRTTDGRIEIEPVPLSVSLKKRGRLLIAVPQETVPPLKGETVKETRRKLRHDRAN